MSMRQGAAAAAALLALGCAKPAPSPTPPVQLSTQNPGANIAPIVAFFRRTCLEHLQDLASFEASLASSGWRATRTQSDGRTAEGHYMPSVWRLDHGELILMSEPPLQNCILSLRSQVAPRFSTLRAALQQSVAWPGGEVLLDDPDQAIWSWPDGPQLRRVLTISVVPASPDRPPGTAPLGVQINLAREPMPAAGTNRE